MKKYFSLLLLLTLIMTFPISSKAEITDFNQEIAISGVLNYDLVIEKRTGMFGFYDGTALDFMYNKVNLANPVAIGNFSYDLIINEYGIDDSILISGSDVTVADINPLSGDGSYTPKSKSLGFIAGTMSGSPEITVTVTYADSTSENKNVTVSPITTKDNSSSVSAGASLIGVDETAIDFFVDDGDEVYLNSYEIDEINPSEISSITFKAGENPYHVMAVSILYYTEAEWQEKINSSIGGVYLNYKNTTPNDTVSNMSELSTLVTSLDAMNGDLSSLSQEVQDAIAENGGVEAEVERLTMLYDCLVLINKKQELKDEMDALSLSDYLDDTESDFALYTTTDEENISALITKFDEASAVDEELTEVLDYWSSKGITVTTAEINLSDKTTLVQLEADYKAYKNEAIFTVSLDALYSSYGTSDLSAIDTDAFAEVKAFFENSNFFDADLVSPFEKSENEDKIAALKYIYLNYEKYKNAEQPFMIDLSKYFSRDIFYDAGDSGNKIGFKGTTITSYDGASTNVTDSVKAPEEVILALDRNVIKGSTYLNQTNGILSFPGDDINLGYGYYKNGHVTSADFKAYMATKPLTFDVSKAMTNGASAVMLPDDGSGGSVQNISGVFSGKTSKYLVFLVAIPRGDRRLNAKINYTDGTSYSAVLADAQRDFFYVYYNASVDTAAMGLSTNQLRTAPWYFDTTFGSWSRAFDDTAHTYPRNLMKIVASAALIPNKQIKSVEIYSSPYYSNADTKFSVNCNIPILAMTEIPIKNTEFITNVAAPAWEAVKNFDKETDYVAANLSKIKAVSEAYEESLLRGLNVDEIFKYDDGSSGVADVEEMATLVLSATSITERTKVDEIKSIISFSVPAANIEDNITVTKSGEKLSKDDYELVVADDNLSAQIIIKENKNGGNKYDFKVSGNLQVDKNKSMTMGIDYTYSYTVPDHIAYDYDNKKLVNNSDVPLTVTAATVAVGNDGKTVYSADSETVADLSKEGPANVSVTLSDSIPSDSKKLSYVFDDKFKLVSNDSDIPVISDAETDVTANYKEPVLNIKTNTLTVKGFTDSKTAGKLVNIRIFDETFNRDIYFGSVKTNKDGFFGFEIKLPEENYLSSFNMLITLGGDDFNTPVTDIKDVYYSAPIERATLITHIKNATDKSALTNGTLISSGDVTISRIVRDLALDFAPVDVISDNEFAQAIVNILEDYQLADLTSDFELTQKVLKQAAILTAYKEEKQDSVYKDGALLYNDIMNYASINTDNVTLYNIFEKNISSEGKDEIIKAVLGNEYKNPGKLYDALVEEIFVKALNYPSGLGTGYIADVLTSKNAQRVNADISKFVNTDAFKNAIAANRGNFTDVASVVSFINSVKVPTPPSTSTSSGSSVSSSPSSSISAGGFNTQDDSSNGAFARPEAPVVPQSNYTFNDVTPAYWAYDHVISLYNKGIVSGKGNKTYDPEGYVTRGEVVKMICVAYNLTNKGETPFTDLSGKWYSEYAAIAYANNLINGVTETTFGGDEKITRQDLCTILYRIKNEEVTGEIDFSDKEIISDYAKNAVTFMNEKGIINGFSDNTFKPNDYCTRAQMAKIFDLFIGL